ncbi:MAG: GNAT family N-acetyltransferase [Reichenbachiella sp.]
MLEIKHRYATIDDLAELVKIYNQAIPTGVSTADTVLLKVEDRIEWFKAFNRSTRPIIVALDGSQIIGYVYLTSFYEGRPAYNKTAEVSTYIANDYQKLGVGTYLKKIIISLCPELGVENLISMYFDHNIGTQKLNDSFGFVVEGHLKNIAEIDGVKRGLMTSVLRLKPVS